MGDRVGLLSKRPIAASGIIKTHAEAIRANGFGQRTHQIPFGTLLVSGKMRIVDLARL